jgi:exosortase
MATAAQQDVPADLVQRPSPATLVTTGLLLAATAWVYWPTLADMVYRWESDPQYSHGFLVPAFSAYLLWSRRGKLAGPVRGSWYGLGLVGLGILVRAVGVVAFVGWFEALSLLVCLAGLVVTVAGWKGLRWAWPAVAFLGFMIPLPYALQTALSGSLQRIATRVSTYLLVAAGVPAVADGNVILLSGDTRLGVVEACSGLGMLVTFFALSAAIAIVMRSEPVWARVGVLVSAVPVAVAVNVVRITATGVLYDASQDEWARWVFHDVAGWLMMPLAVLMFFLLLWLAHRIIAPVRALPAVA